MTVETLSRRLKQIMDNRGLKAAPLARDAGLGVDFVRDILRGHVKSPRGENLVKLAHHLGVTVEFLQGTSDEIPSAGLSENAVDFIAASAGAASPQTTDIARFLAPSVHAPETMLVRVNMPGFYLAAGDQLIVDVHDTPQANALVVVNVLDNDDGPGTTEIRRFLPPYLAAHDLSPPLLNDNNRNTIMATVVASYRPSKHEDS